jgi:DNA-directed RNA polymerase subunit RPC12/RpoP
MIFLPESAELVARRNAVAAIIAAAPASAPFKCLRCNRIFRPRALCALVQLRCRGCGRRDFVPITEAEVAELVRS